MKFNIGDEVQLNFTNKTIHELNKCDKRDAIIEQRDGNVYKIYNSDIMDGNNYYDLGCFSTMIREGNLKLYNPEPLHTSPEVWELPKNQTKPSLLLSCITLLK